MVFTALNSDQAESCAKKHVVVKKFTCRSFTWQC